MNTYHTCPYERTRRASYVELVMFFFVHDFLLGTRYEYIYAPHLVFFVGEYSKDGLARTVLLRQAFAHRVGHHPRALLKPLCGSARHDCERWSLFRSSCWHECFLQHYVRSFERPPEKSTTIFLNVYFDALAITWVGSNDIWPFHPGRPSTLPGRRGAGVWRSPCLASGVSCLRATKECRMSAEAAEPSVP